MDNIYLSASTKASYQRDFIENVLSETHEGWKLSSFIVDHLVELNKSNDVQPLYSKFPDNSLSLSRNESYLEIAYAENVELKLFRETLPTLLIKHNDNGSKLNYLFHEPRDNANYRDGARNFKMGCLTNPDYFRINHVRISFYNDYKENHVRFWDDLKNSLIAI